MQAEPERAVAPLETGSHSRLLPILVFAFAFMQFMIPLLLLRSPQVTRFSWQMFSRTNGVMDFVVVDADGRSAKVTPETYIGNLRGDLDTERIFPPEVCRRMRTITTVRWVSIDKTKKEFRCR